MVGRDGGWRRCSRGVSRVGLALARGCLVGGFGRGEAEGEFLELVFDGYLGGCLRGTVSGCLAGLGGGGLTV